MQKARLINQADTHLSFQCTPEALERINLLKFKTTSQFWKGLEDSLGVVRWIPGEPVLHPANVHTYPGLTAAVYQEAVDNYLKRMRRSR